MRWNSEPSRPIGREGVTRGCSTAYPSTTRPASGVESRVVERMRHLADEPSDGLPRQPRVAVERDDITNAGRRDGRLPSDRDECRIAPRRAAAGSTRGACRVCVPSQSTVSAPRSRPADDGAGGNGHPRVPVRSGDSDGRCPRRQHREGRHLPRRARSRRPPNPRAARNKGRLPGLQGSGPPDARFALRARPAS